MKKQGEEEKCVFSIRVSAGRQLLVVITLARRPLWRGGATLRLLACLLARSSRLEDRIDTLRRRG